MDYLNLAYFSQSGATPLALIALLLFREPSVFTLRTLLALLGFGERSQNVFDSNYPLLE